MTDLQLKRIPITTTGMLMRRPVAEVFRAFIDPEWPGYSGLTTVEWTFLSQPDGTTFVRIAESGFIGDADQLVEQVTNSTQGFTLVLAGLKALLEHDVQLNLVADRYPKGIENHA